jgi:hypothetical protein
MDQAKVEYSTEILSGNPQSEKDVEAAVCSVKDSGNELPDGAQAASAVLGGSSVTMTGLRRSRNATNHTTSSSGSSSYWESDLNDDEEEEEDSLYGDDFNLYDDEKEADDSSSLADQHQHQQHEPRASMIAPQSGAFSLSPSQDKASGESIQDNHGSAVPVNEAEETKRLQEMEERPNREIEEQRAEEQQISSQRGIKSKTVKKCFCSKEKIPIVMALLLILCGIGVAIYSLLLAPDSSSAPTASDKDDSISLPSASPTEAVKLGYDPH